MMGGTMRAPLTATLFAVELTGNLSALLALLIACTTAHTMTVLLLRHSILTEKIARRGRRVSYEYGLDPFAMARVEEVMVREVNTLPASLPVQEALGLFTNEKIPAHSSYPVINDEGKVIGMAGRSDIFRWASDSDADSTILGNILPKTPLFSAYPDELVSDLADRMMEADIGRVPVIDREIEKLIGLVARKDLLKLRAKALIEDRDRQAFFRRKSVPPA
jgi:CBS domain-containing protein